MRARFLAIAARGLGFLLVGLAGCTPPVTPGFYGQYQVASRSLSSLGQKKSTADGVLHFPSANGSTVDPAAGPCPVVLLIPGYMEPPLFYASYGEQLASWGYVVLLAHFTGLFDFQAQQEAARLIQWLRDEQAGSGLLAGWLDMDRLGVAGHSTGGKYALLTALDEAAVGAVVAIDPVDGSAELLPPNPLFGSFTPQKMPEVTAPTCILGAEIPGPLNPPGENYHQFFLHASSCHAQEVLILGADHASFLDDYAGFIQYFNDSLFRNPSSPDNLTKNITARYMIAWFNVHLRGDQEFLTYLTGEHAAQDVAAGLVRIQTRN